MSNQRRKLNFFSVLSSPFRNRNDRPPASNKVVQVGTVPSSMFGTAISHKSPSGTSKQPLLIDGPQVVHESVNQRPDQSTPTSQSMAMISADQVHINHGNFVLNTNTAPLEQGDYYIEKCNALIRELPSTLTECARRHEDCRREWSATPSAGQWLRQHPIYLAWRDKRNRLLRIIGEPGAGKTILASILVEDLRLHLQRTRGETTGGIVTFHYCRFDQPAMCDPMSIFGTLLQQLIEGLPHGSATLLNLDKTIIREMNRLSDVIITMADAFGESYFILDGFDECDRKSRRLLRPILDKLKAHIKILIISRDIQDIRRYFSNEHLYIRICARDVQTDITKFLHKTVYPSGVDTDTDDVRLVLPPNHPRGGVAKIINDLSRRAGGNFLWVKLQVLHLMKCTTPYHIENALRELPPGLPETFMRSIDSINALPTPTAHQCLRALLWLASTRVPLNPTELTEAVAIGDMDDTWDPNRVVLDPMVIIDHCANLISIDQHVHLFHPSVKDFLVLRPDLFTPVLPIYIAPDEHCLPYLLAHDCLKYLSIIRADNLTQFFLHASQNFTHYLRDTEVYGKKLSNLFIAVVQSAVARDILVQYKFSSTCDLSGYVIHAAAALHLPEILKVLLRKPSLAWSYVDRNRCTPLHHAECQKCVEILLKSNRFNVNAVNRSGETALHSLALLATRTPAANTVRIGSDKLESLLKTMLRVEVRCVAQACSPEKRAAQLIEHKANINIHDYNGRTPLHILPVHRPEIINLLADSYTIDAVDHQSRVPLTLLLRQFSLGTFPIVLLMKIFWVLMEKNPNINIPDSTGCTPLHHAAVLNNLPTEAFVKLCNGNEGQAAASAKNNKGQIPLHLAAINDCSIDIFRNLLQISEDVLHEVDSMGRTALHYTCQFHSPEKVSLLLSRGAENDVLMRDVDRRTPLHFATKYRASEQVLTWLVERSSLVWHVLDCQGHTAFDYAVGPAVGIMMKHGCDIFNVPGVTTTLLAACSWPNNPASRFRQSRTKSIRILLLQGAHKTIGAVDHNGQTAIHLAVRNHIRKDVLLSMLDNEAADGVIHTTDRLGRTALNYACIPKSSTGTAGMDANAPPDSRVTVLLSQGGRADIRVPDFHLRQTPIHVATICASPATLKLLVEALGKSSDVLHDLDVTRRTALHYACDPRSASVEKVDILLEHGASDDIEVFDHRMQTPLHLAAMLHGWETLARLLDSNSSALGFIDLKGRTPLHYACMRWIPGPIQKISLLLTHGADKCVGIPDGPTGRTPIHIAVISGTPAPYLVFLLNLEPSAIHVRDNIGRTPLHYACHGRLGLRTLDPDQRAERVSVLVLQYGAQLHIPDNRGQTPIDIAIKTCASHEILEILGVENRLEKRVLSVYTHFGTLVIEHLPTYTTKKTGTRVRIP